MISQWLWKKEAGAVSYEMEQLVVRDTEE